MLLDTQSQSSESSQAVVATDAATTNGTHSAEHGDGDQDSGEGTNPLRYAAEFGI